uniref:Uncharacterized protein n=1 Tax=Arundo donax TaxID=35708 RepID=A0A0A9F2U7_ARUDO
MCCRFACYIYFLQTWLFSGIGYLVCCGSVCERFVSYHLVCENSCQTCLA